MGHKLTKAEETRVMLTLPLEMRLMGVLMRWRHTEPGARVMALVEGVIYSEEWTWPTLRIMAEALKQRPTFGTSEPMSEDSWKTVELYALRLARKQGLVKEYLNDWWLVFDLASSIHPDEAEALLDEYIEAAQEAELVGRIEQMREAVHGGDLPSQAVQGLQEEVRQRAMQRRDAMEPPGVSARHVLGEVFEDFNNHVEGKSVEGLPLPSKFKALNEAIGGWYVGVSFIAGRPKHGKSTLFEQEMIDAALRGHHVALVSLEMSRKKTMRRLVARMAGIPVNLIESPVEEDDGHMVLRLTEDQAQRMTNAAGIITELPIDFIDVTKTDRTWPTVLTRMTRHIELTGKVPDLWGIDHLHKLIIETTGRLDTAYNDVIESLDQWSHAYGTRVIALAQLNRRVEQEKRLPMGSDIREAGGVEQTAQAVVYPWREYVLGRSVDTVFAGHLGECERCDINTFTRNGPGGVAKLLWSRNRALWAEKDDDALPV